MSELTRVSLSLNTELLNKLEHLATEHGYQNRSEFIRDMIRERLTQEQWEKGDEVLGTLSLIYNHHQHGLTEKLVELQHHSSAQVLASTHVHLTHEICAEMIMLRGRSEAIQELANAAKRQRGVLHGALSISSTGEKLC